MTGICEQCGNEYKEIAKHWSMSNCEWPSFTDQQREIITGLLMGDGSINRSKNRNPRLECSMISPNYLKYIDEKFDIFGKGTSLRQTAKESAESNRNRGFRTNAKAENYHDLYIWRSMAHPELQEFENWYSSNKKVWPKSIELTPVVLKHWYCGDGNWNNSSTNNYIAISMSNEKNNTGKVSKIFERVGLPAPSCYVTSERTDGSIRCSAQFTVEQSKELWEYMGEPLPDFEYKWPEKYR